MGDSIALVCNDKLIKLHIHTNEPELVFEKLRGYGTITSQKVEDMKDLDKIFSTQINSPFYP